MPARDQWIRVGIHIILVLAIVEFIILPLRDLVEKDRQELSTLRKAYATRQAIIQHRPEVEERIKRSMRVLETVTALLYSGEMETVAAQAQMQSSLKEMARAAGLKISMIEWGEPVGRRVMVLPLTLRMRGDLRQFKNFLKNVQNAEKIFTIDTVTMTPYKEKLTITVHLKGYKLL